MNRRARPLAAALLVAAALTGPVVLEGTSAADTTFDGQYNLSSAAHGLSITFGNPSAQPYPLGAGQVPETQSSLNTGPASYALASVFWPGPLAANAGSLAGLVLPACSPPNIGPVNLPAGACSPAPNQLPVPVAFANYPVRAEAAFPGGKESDALGPLTSRATGDSSEGAATVTDFASSSVVSAARMTVHSRSFENSGKLTALGESVITGLNLGNGAITIDAIKTVATSTTDGKSATASHTVTVKGVSVQGRAATVDQNGVHFNGADTNPLTAPEASANDMLARGNMRLFLTKPVSEESNGSAARASSGTLVFSWILDGANRLIVTIGGADANAQAVPGLDLSALGIDDVLDDAGLAGSVPSALDAGIDSSVLGSTTTGPLLPDATSGAGATAAGAGTRPGAPLSGELTSIDLAGFTRGTPAGAVIFALFCVVLAASLLRRGQVAAAAAIAADRTVCPNDRSEP